MSTSTTSTFPDTIFPLVLPLQRSTDRREVDPLRGDPAIEDRRSPLGPRGEVLAAVVLLAITVWHFMPLPHRVEVSNAGAVPMRGVVLRVGDEEITAGDLAPGQRFFHTLFVRRRLGSTIEASALVDGSRTSLGQCGDGLLSAMHTRVALHDGGLDGCRSEPPRIGYLP